jgi:hypothetical protein
MLYLSSAGLLQPLAEPERYLRYQRRIAKQLKKMVGRTIADFAKPPINALGSSISRPMVDANNFEIKTHVIHMIQSSCTFYGLTDEDPHAHIANFLEICDTFKINGVSNDAIRLRMFPFSLRDRLKHGLIHFLTDPLPLGTILLKNSFQNISLPLKPPNFEMT